MATVALTGQKGGAGKSSLAISLAAEWHSRGKKVLLVDLDPQGTSVTWGDVAAEAEVEAPAVVGMGDAIRKQLPAVAADYEHVVIDCPPRAGKRTVGALMVADLAVLPCGPSPADVWALTEAVEVLESAQGLRDELQARIVLNGLITGSTLGGDVEEALAELSPSVMASRIHSRVSMARTLATGQGVTVSEPGSIAALEVRKWVDEIEDILAGGDE